MREYEATLQDLNKSIELNPSLAFAYITRGIVHYSLGDHASELADYETAISLTPQDPLPYVNRGIALAELGRIDEARASLNKALELGFEASVLERN